MQLDSKKTMELSATEHCYITLLVDHLTCLSSTENREQNLSDTRQFEPTSFNSHSCSPTCCAHIPQTVTTVNLKKKKKCGKNREIEVTGLNPRDDNGGSEWINWTGVTQPSIMAVQMPLKAALNLHLLQWSCSVAAYRLHWATSKCVCVCLYKSPVSISLYLCNK